MMQMQFLGEDFNPKLCNKMCDNCKRGLSVVSMDMYNESCKIFDFLAAAHQAGNNFTMAQAIDILRGRKLTSKIPIQKNIVTDYSGALKKLKEDVLRRLLVKLLVSGAIEERFVNMKAGMISTVVVYLQLGKNYLKVREKRCLVFLSDGVKNKDEEE